MHTFTWHRRFRLLLLGAPLLAAACASAPQGFASPEAAAQALATAAREDSASHLEQLFGSEGAGLVGSGDPVEDRNARASFAEMYDERHHIETEGSASATLLVGADDWPFPMPIVKDSRGQWVFDVAAGAEEIIDRRIGRNELSTIETCRAVCDAQREFAAMKLEGKAAGEYACRFLCSAGKHDGLYWPPVAGEPESPLGPLVAEAQQEGYAAPTSHDPQPYHGYYYRMLDAQGDNAPGGAAKYLQDGHMTRGFAVIAWPAEYGSSGVMSFLVCANGIVYQADLGDDTDQLARKMSAYDPDPNWSICD